MNHQANFWQYTGNHPSGRNQLRYDPHNYGLKVISFMAYIGTSGNYGTPLTYEDTLEIHVKQENTWAQLRETGVTGRNLEVKAPPEVWAKCQAWIQNENL